MNLFYEHIGNWQDWSRVFTSIPAFSALAERIMKNAGLPFPGMENLTPGTNAVFKIGDYVIKIYSPCESGYDGCADMETEVKITKLAAALGVSCPVITECGVIDDKYRFGYIIMNFVHGTEFSSAVSAMRGDEKHSAARALRAITDRLNVPCEPFNNIDVIDDIIKSDLSVGDRQRRWSAFPESFRRERQNYVKSRDYGEKVFVHGDLCGDNILVSDTGGLCVIDFADAVTAPKIYDDALIISELFDFDRELLYGYFGHTDADILTDICFNGLIIHPFGTNIISQHIANPGEISTLSSLKDKIKSRFGT